MGLSAAKKPDREVYFTSAERCKYIKLGSKWKLVIYCAATGFLREEEGTHGHGYKVRLAPLPAKIDAESKRLYPCRM